MGLDGVKLTVEDDAVREIANTAIRLKTGARGLRTIIEGLMTDVMYDIPGKNNVEEVIITKGCVMNGDKPTLVYKKPHKEQQEPKHIGSFFCRKEGIMARKEGKFCKKPRFPLLSF